MSENRAVWVAALLLLMTGASFAQVENAADASAGVPGSSAVAPGSQAFVSDAMGIRSTSNVASVSIRPVGSATPIPAQVLGASETGITFVVPPDTPLGNAQLIYNQTGQLTQSTSVSIVSSHLALYRNPRAVNINTSGPATPNGLANPAQPGQFVEIFATGLTAIPQFPPQVLLGNVAQSVLYAGSGGPAGLLQINFEVSADAPDGCYVPLTVTWGASTATSSISKTSDGMACHHPFGLSTQALQALDSGGSVETGMVTMSSALSAASADHASRSEQASVTVTYLSAAQIASYATSNPALGCGMNNGSVPNFISALFDPDQFGSTMTLQNGSTKLQLPSGEGADYSVTILATADAPLNHLPAPVLGGGAWTLNFTAGQFGFNLLPPVQINGSAPIQIQTNQNQTITWNGSGFDAGAMMQLSLSAGNFGPPTITCFAAAQAGALTIPANLLKLFTSGGAGVLSAGVAESGASMPHSNFQLDGAPLLMLVSEGSTDTRPVDFQ